MTAQIPKTLIEVIRYFSDQDRCLKFFIQMRWPDGITCPHCGSIEGPETKHSFLKTRRVWMCRDCRKQFSAKKNTVLEDSALGLDIWFSAMWMIANCKNGISSYEIHRALGITQKSAWHLLHRIRLVLGSGSWEKKVTGTCEVDEAYVGGKLINMHKSKREKLPKGRGTVGKQIVLGILERGNEGALSTVRAKVIQDIKTETLQGEVRSQVEPGSNVYTDALSSYQGLDDQYVHEVVDHAFEYVRDAVHTNSLEGFWALLKRTIRGTYTHIGVEHLPRYLSEQAYRYNYRKDDDAERFLRATRSVEGKRLTYQELTGKDAQRKTSKPENTNDGNPGRKGRAKRGKGT